MKCLPVTLLVCALALGACRSDARDDTPPTTPPEPALVGPVLVYTEMAHVDEPEDPQRSFARFVVAYDAGARREVRRTRVTGFWSLQLADGRNVALAGHTDGVLTIDLLDALSGQRQTVYSVRSNGPRDGAPIAVSPDGTLIAFTEFQDRNDYATGKSFVKTLNLATGETLLLATFAGKTSGEFNGWPNPRVWRDDGQGVLLHGDTSSGAAGSWATVWLDGAVTVHVRDFASPSPSGTALVLQDITTNCLRPDEQRMRIYRTDDQAEIVVARDQGKGMLVREWSPDGKELLYVQYQTADRGDGCTVEYLLETARYFVASTADGSVREVTDIDALRRDWNGGRLITFSCIDGRPLTAWQHCVDDVEKNIHLDGVFIDSGDDIRVLGFIERHQLQP